MKSQEEQRLIKEWRNRLDSIGFSIELFRLENTVSALQSNQLYEESRFLGRKKKNGKRPHSARGFG